MHLQCHRLDPILNHEYQEKIILSSKLIQSDMDTRELQGSCSYVNLRVLVYIEKGKQVFMAPFPGIERIN